MKKHGSYQEFLPILAEVRLFEGIPAEHYDHIFEYLGIYVLFYEKEEFIQRLGEPMLCSGVVLEGTVEGSFISENYNKINMNYFTPGNSFGEALACVSTSYSPIQLKALTDCTVMFINLKQILSDAPCNCRYQQRLSTNLIRILASQNVFSNLKLRIANQKALRDRIMMYLYSLAPDREGFVHIPFTQTALAEFLGVNRSALSRELGRMQNEGLLQVNGKSMKLML
ncbi:MAG: Crp/Fnr family transcriptional regulator [Lachnospiraceae bacterium]|nr:Crp/Fnr family transcriptional regulator [Lachnospiraceae bacterium]